jgi:hypothetical protein
MSKKMSELEQLVAIEDIRQLKARYFRYRALPDYC